MTLQRYSLAFPAVLSMALLMTPLSALAGLVVSGSTATFSDWGAPNGIVSGRDFFTPPVTTLNVSNLYGDIWPDRPWYGEPGQSPGISLTHQAANGSNGGFGADGHSGAAGLSLTINLQGPWYNDWGTSEEAGILTSLWYNNGIQAMSVGGNGGNGGDAYGYFFGGDGGHGGNGGAVNVRITTADTNFISTSGDGAQGVFVLSQGGNGGHGGDAYSIGAVGGDGGRGGNGGNVNLSITASVGTNGKNANGLLAQSLGGASGYGGAGGGLFGGGGAGSNSGKGGTVDVTTGTAGIWTFGQESHGILAQSIGGFARGAGTGGGVLGWGGSGASSGDGGFVKVTNNGLIETKGAGSHAIFGQSVGGGGGNAGIGGGVLAIGGGGSAGGNGGIVVISNYGFLRTYADSALGILAQSIGGGGGAGEGAGGFMSLGGSGSSSGDGGGINVNSYGTIITSGSHSGSILAQSIGGGGGRARASGGVLLSFGGEGSGGGNGGYVGVSNAAYLVTQGFDSTAILAQSIGGGGGAGGSVYGYGLGLTYTRGGASQAGGNGGDVTVSNTGYSTILTGKDFSRGIHAQSIGGGGGNGGDVLNYTGSVQVSASYAMGGRAGGGGSGGEVNIYSGSGSYIGTYGKQAHAIYAQSVGGGGGSGGSTANWNVTIGDVIDEFPSLSFGMSVGGSGGNGGHGGVAGVTSGATIETAGFRSYGIFAQSVGGGGGDGGNSMTGAIAFDAFSLTTAVGGKGGQGGNGNSVSVNNSGNIRTVGDFGYGILGQSVGGGGGSGGNSTTFQLDAGIMPHLDDFLLIAPDFGFSLSVGGSSTGGGHGGAVDISSTGPITTSGGFAHGILAQSVGGGGGSAGDATTIEVAAGIDPSEVLPFTRSMNANNVMLLGGQGGAGGNGGLVTVQNRGDITTAGGFAAGILAQSIGGGGGTSGFSIKDQYSLINPLGSSTILHGGNGASGNGSDVSVTNSARITTNGVFAHGILAQSIGGGGGFGGINEASGLSSLGLSSGAHGVFAQNTGFGVGFAGSIGGSGAAGAVNVTHTGSITTFGKQSHGILAQSAAGTGTAGAVTVTLASSVIANGVDSDGIRAQSTGGTGRGNISITNGGIVQGGSGAGVGVNIDGGANNTLTNTSSGTISALSGRAVTGGIGNDTIVNYGAVIGSVELGSGTNAFQNKAGARFDAGRFVDLGAGNALINDGIFSPGGAGTILGTTVFGDFVQSDIGILEIDIGGFSEGLFDSIDVTGTLTGGTDSTGSSLLGGTIQFSFLSGYDIFAGIDPGERVAFEFLDVEGNPGFLSASLFSYEFLGDTSGLRFDVFLRDGGLYLEALYAVPAPGTLSLVLLGLIGLVPLQKKTVPVPKPG